MAFFLPYSVNSGSLNMKLDEKLLNLAIDKKLKTPILRLYGWNPPCVSLGRNQNENSINQDFCKSKGIDIVRRLTGGRALLHDEELTYSFTAPADFLKNGGSVISSYKEISSALVEGFSSLGIQLEFPSLKKIASKFDYCMSISTGADLSVEGKKLIGSAQFRKQNYILQHGSILIRYNKELIKAIFNEKIQEDKITSLDNLGFKNLSRESTNPAFQKLCDSLRNGFETFFDIELKPLEEEFLETH